jgi:hypothetical protein
MMLRPAQPDLNAAFEISRAQSLVRKLHGNCLQHERPELIVILEDLVAGRQIPVGLWKLQGA